YRVVVGRSAGVTGPYLDRSGVPMLAGGGTELLRGYNEFRGPGGGDVYGDRYVHHYYDLFDNGAPKLSVRPLRWPGGWPALGDPQWGWLHNDCQQFAVDPASGGWSVIRSKLNGRVLQPAGCTGDAIQTATATGATCQEFRPQPVGNVLIADPTATRALNACGR